ncbi:glycosyltransferase family 2 protein [Candidatus Woesebacteria bacterium]|nr:glycosyltransferase family 2 protein [Candidatus Woesebacteria bacterium]QQG47032.1 MAG: glycosyltransferase family 2 protein [Candidatus Woesebacteria bacterium]
MEGLSVVINTLNEEKNLPSAITSIKDLASEIIVVDMYSDDKTTKIAKKLGAKVFMHDKTNYVEPARNFAISKASCDWILILDADEEIPPKLSKEIKKIVKDSKADYFRLPRKNIIFGKWIKDSGWWPDYNIRLFRKNFVSWNEIIHTVPITTGIGADLKDSEDLAIIHHNYQSIEQFIDRMNRYTTIQAKIAFGKKENFNWQNLIKKPLSEFLNRYYSLQGYKGGLHSLSLCLLQAASELVKELKLWQLYKFNDQKITFKENMNVIKESQKEFNYWIHDTNFKETGSVKSKIKRKFRLS